MSKESDDQQQLVTDSEPQPAAGNDSSPPEPAVENDPSPPKPETGGGEEGGSGEGAAGGAAPPPYEEKGGALGPGPSDEQQKSQADPLPEKKGALPPDPVVNPHGPEFNMPPPPAAAFPEPVGPCPVPDQSVAPPPYMPNEQQQQQCILSYVDFLPGPSGTSPEGLPEFQQFDAMIQQANYWLSQNPHMQPICCETVERKIEEVGDRGSKTKKIDMQGMGFNEVPFEETNIYIMGLRVWVNSRFGPILPPVQIGYWDCTANKSQQSANERPGHTRKRNYPGFEGASSIIAKMNSTFASAPLPGHVLNVQTVEVRVGQTWSDALLQVNRGSWITEKKTPHMLMHFIRLYYVQGPPTTPNLGILDFIPKMMRRPNGDTDPQFEKMSELTKKVNVWIASNPSRKAVGMQTIDTRHDSHFWIDSATKTVKLQTDTTDAETSELHRWDRVLRIIRLIFLNDGGQAYPGPPPEPTNLQLKTYPPLGTGRSFEQLVQTTARLQTYLTSNPGVRVLHAETVTMDYRAGGNHTSEIDLALSRLDNDAKRIFYFSAIRLYLSAPQQLTKPVKSSTCAVL